MTKIEDILNQADALTWDELTRLVRLLSAMVTDMQGGDRSPDKSDWDACAEALGGTSNSLLVGFAAKNGATTMAPVRESSARLYTGTYPPMMMSMAGWATSAFPHSLPPVR